MVACLTEIAGALGVAYLVSSECSKVGSTWLLSLALLDAGKAVALKRLTRRAYTDDSLVDEAVRAVDELLTALPAAAGAAPRPVPLPPAPAAAAPPPAPAAPPSDTPPGFHQHDGFFLGLHLGFGGLRSSNGSQTLSGASGSFSVAVGSALSRNLVLYFHLFDEVDTSPKLQEPALAPPLGKASSHSLIAYGAGVAWYFLPSNAYLGATLALAQAELETADVTVRSKWGPALRLSLGKEWWASTDWGLGAAVHLTGASNRAALGRPGTAERTLSSGAVSVTFSATYN